MQVKRNVAGLNFIIITILLFCSVTDKFVLLKIDVESTILEFNTRPIQ